MQAHPASRPLLRLEWGALAAVLFGFVLWFSGPEHMPRINHLVQDTVSWLYPRRASPDIVIVTIDAPSLQAIGRWPWRRALHAELIQRISAHTPRAIGMDILLGEEDLDYPEDDMVLAQAMRNSGRVVLPVIRRGATPGGRPGAERPFTPFAQAAAELGHVHVHMDSDGVMRSFYRQEGPASAPWPHLSLAMTCVAGAVQPTCQSNTSLPRRGAWVRKDPQIIAFAHGAAPFTSYSYIDVLRGQVPAAAFRDKYVLVGATAPGLGDLLPAPVGLQVHHMPNVELVAHILNNALTDVRIQPASGLVNSIFNLVPVGLALWALAALGPSAALMGCIGLAIAMLAFAGLSPWIWQVMLSPAAGLAGIAMAYPLWSWRRLSAATRFLELEMKTLRREGLPISLAEDDLHRGDFLERRIRAVEQASEHLRNLHHFVSTSLQQLPSPTFVCDAQGRVLLANAAAALHLGIKVQDIHGALLPTLLQKLMADDSGQPLLQESQFQTGTLPPQSEGRDADGRSMLLLAKPFAAPPAQGWLITLVDLTDMRQAQKQRDQAMHFISHDIRAPIGSILTLLEMQREYPDQMPASELMARIERYAQASLALAENFVHLASAKYHAYQFAPVDLAALLEEAVDDAWAALREHKLSMDVVMEEDCAYCMGDRALLSRAITNILGNAIKFSPEGGKLSCALSLRAESWVLVVRDQGPGISAKDQQRLFLPFERMHSHSHPSVAGAGLGLAFVHTVVLRHGGSIEVESQEGHGAEFRLVLPRTKVAPPEDLTDAAG